MAAKYKRILVAVDGTEEADAVLAAAADVAPRNTDGYHVLTVIQPVLAGIGGVDGASFAATWPLKELEAAATREIAEAVRERAARHGISPERVAVGYGRAVTEILDYAQKINADLIVVGSHGRRGFPRVLLGSTANGVLHGAQCDVLTVRIGE
jgi:universal stress protein A